MELTVTNIEQVPDDLEPGIYCCRIESATWQELKVRFVPGSQHQPGDCLIQLTKQAPACRECDGKGYLEGPGCNCGVGPAGYYGMHERYCGLEPCPAGCQFVPPAPPEPELTPTAGKDETR